MGIENEFQNDFEERKTRLQNTSGYLTYFKDKYGLIYYSNGIVGVDPKSTRAVLVYQPSQTDEARWQPETGMFYRKNIDNGGLDVISDGVIEGELNEVIKSRRVRNPETHDAYLSVPLADITDVYDPFTSHHSIIGARKAPIGAEYILECVENFTSILRAYGVAKDDIGLYGGLQAGIFPTDATRFHDVDIRIRGIEYLPTVKVLAADMKKPLQLAMQGDNPIVSAMRKRMSLLQFKLDNLTVDLKVVRKESDLNSFPANDHVDGYVGEGEQRGFILDDREAVTSPTSFMVGLEDGREIAVTTLMYNYIGAAWSGDKVRFRGLQTPNATMLTDPQKHFILADA